MSYTIPTDYYWNPGKPAYGPGFDEPVPGWGFRPNMVGPRRVGVGATDMVGGALESRAIGMNLSPADRSAVLAFLHAVEACCGFSFAEGTNPTKSCVPGPGMAPTKEYVAALNAAKALSPDAWNTAMNAVMSQGLFSGRESARNPAVTILKRARVTAPAVPPGGMKTPTISPSTTAGVAMGLEKFRKTLTGEDARAFAAFTMAAEACGKQVCPQVECPPGASCAPVSCKTEWCQPDSPQAKSIAAAAAALSPSVRQQAYAIASQSSEPLPKLLAQALSEQAPKESPPGVSPPPAQGMSATTVALYAGGALLLGAALVYALKSNKS